MLTRAIGLPIVGLSAVLLGGHATAGFQRTLPNPDGPIVQTVATAANVADPDLPDDYSLGLFQVLGGTTQVKPKLRVVNGSGFDLPSGRLGGGVGGWSSLGGFGGALAAGGGGFGGLGGFGGRGVGTRGDGTTGEAVGTAALTASVPAGFTPLPASADGPTVGGVIVSPFLPLTEALPPLTDVSPPGGGLPQFPTPPGGGGGSAGAGGREEDGGPGNGVASAPEPSGGLLFLVGAACLSVVGRVRRAGRSRRG